MRVYQKDRMRQIVTQPEVGDVYIIALGYILTGWMRRKEGRKDVMTCSWSGVISELVERV